MACTKMGGRELESDFLMGMFLAQLDVVLTVAQHLDNKESVGLLCVVIQEGDL